jgi:hypothetical protein
MAAPDRRQQHERQPLHHRSDDGDSALIDPVAHPFRRATGFSSRSTLYVMQNGNTPQPGVLNEIVVIKLKKHRRGSGRRQITNRFRDGDHAGETRDILGRSTALAAPIDPESVVLSTSTIDARLHCRSSLVTTLGIPRRTSRAIL